MIADHKGEIPFVVLIVPYLLGIGLGINLLSGTNLNRLTVLFFLLILVFISLNLTYRGLKIYRARWLGGLLISVMLFLFGWINVVGDNELNRQNHFSRTPAQYLVVKVNNEPILKNGLLRFTAHAEESINNSKKTVVSGTLLIAIKDSAAKTIYYGDELLIPAKYNSIEPPFNPAEFNYKKYLANQNIYYQAFLYPKQYIVLNNNAGNPVIAYSLRLRQRLIEKFKVNMRDTDAIAVASTLILGYKADLSNDVLQAYSKTGTIHVLSVSGAHVAIIYILLTLILGFLDRYKYGKLFKALVIISLIWYYSLLSGFSPAVCRAAVMITMFIIGKTYNRYINTLNILAVSAFLLLMYNPLFITDVGFQLSYLAVFGLVVFQPIVYKWFKFKHKWADKLWALCSVSIAAQVITFPLSAFYFHQFPVYFLISNLIIIIPTAVIMYSGIIYLLLPQIPFLSKGLALVLEWFILLMNKALAIIEHSPYASISRIWPTTFEYLLLYVIIFSLFYFLYYKKVWQLKISLLALLVFSINTSLQSIKESNTDTISFLNLKKHTGIVFKKGDEAIVLSDLNAADKIYQYSVKPYLDSCRISCVKVLNLNQNISTPWLIKTSGLIQFSNKKILIANNLFKINGNRIAFDLGYLYVGNNSVSSLNKLNNKLVYKTLILDGTNSDRLIADIGKQAKMRNRDCKVLKRNNSFISVSN